MANFVVPQHKDLKTHPQIINNLAKIDITVKVKINEGNIGKGVSVYNGTNICKGFYTPELEAEGQSESMQQSTIQVKFKSI